MANESEEVKVRHKVREYETKYRNPNKVQIAFEAPSLEEFLITELRPPDNVRK